MARVIKAYWGSGSAPARRMLLALEEKSLKYVSCCLSFANNELKTAEYLKLNPRGKVPTLTDGDVAIYESLAILEYLESAYPEHPLLPSDLKSRANVLTKMHESSYFCDAVVAVAQYSMRTKKEDWKKEDLEPLKQKVHEELGFWENVLKGKTFVAGDQVTLADIALYPFLSSGVRFGLKFDSFPSVGAYVERFDKRPSAVNTFPPHWKESVGNGVFSF